MTGKARATSKRPSAKARLGKLTGDLYSEIVAMTPRQRSNALAMLDKLNDRNCGWTLYRMRDVLRGFINDASSARARAARARRVAARAVVLCGGGAP